jgi:hypothetical protein
MLREAAEAEVVLEVVDPLDLTKEKEEDDKVEKTAASLQCSLGGDSGAR